MFTDKLKNSLKTAVLFIIQLVISTLVFVATFILIIGSLGYNILDIFPYFILTLSLALLFSTLIEWLFLNLIYSDKALKFIHFSRCSTKNINEILLIFIIGITLMTIVAGVKIDINSLGLNFSIIINHCVAVVLAYKLNNK